MDCGWGCRPFLTVLAVLDRHEFVANRHEHSVCGTAECVMSLCMEVVLTQYTRGVSACQLQSNMTQTSLYVRVTIYVYASVALCCYCCSVSAGIAAGLGSGLSSLYQG